MKMTAKEITKFVASKTPPMTKSPAEKPCENCGKPSKRKLGPYEFRCVKCRRIHKMSSYCVAQQTMGHTVLFTCDCGHKQEVPD